MSTLKYVPETEVRFDSYTGVKIEHLSHWIRDEKGVVAIVVNGETANKYSHILAAAPEMLDAMRSIYSKLRADLSTAELCELADIAGAAIAKADGMS